MMLTVTEQFRRVRDRLVDHQLDWDQARADFEWPHFEHFNFGLDWFDAVADTSERKDAAALVIAEEDGQVLRRTFAELSRDSNKVAQWLQRVGVQRGDRVILMLNNQIELWESMLGCIKTGAVMIPTTTQMGPEDLQDRVNRASARWVIVSATDAHKFADVAGDYTVISVPGYYTPDAILPRLSERSVLNFTEAYQCDGHFQPEAPTPAEDTLLLYFTSGTTSKPKLVEHTHVSYPVGHLSTMYWIGLEPGDVHLNLASPGWAKHAWSNFFAPWIAEATIFVLNYRKFDAAGLMSAMDANGVTSFCAPPTVWRMLIKADLSTMKHPPQKTVSAGEPLNAEVIDQVHRAWGATIRDGFGQTESSLQIANTPGQRLEIGSMGRPLPGFDVVLVDPITGAEAREGEICLKLEPRPIGLMRGYSGDAEKTEEAFRDGLYHTGDIASVNEHGVYTYVGRSDDVFKSSDYKISPFELESVLVEHPAVLEAAVVPVPDELRLTIPKAFVTLASGVEPTRETAQQILQHTLTKLPPYKRIRLIEFRELPKTISGKVRRVDLRSLEADRDEAASPRTAEFHESDLQLDRDNR
ncbi:AMP-binding protein [Citricoccus muralis]|uniref:AMP-binding protein n=1 Tax=Citricoccus muralis TaxID=169134 RepID=A0ABY8H5F6_9MICC|nr:AMP-binding protein [Citricoccus muralis]WFP15883.1 AMP-binding protein [Citricoccus muralis]